MAILLYETLIYFGETLLSEFNLEDDRLDEIPRRTLISGLFISLSSMECDPYIWPPNTDTETR